MQIHLGGNDVHLLIKSLLHYISCYSETGSGLSPPKEEEHLIIQAKLSSQRVSGFDKFSCFDYK